MAVEEEQTAAPEVVAAAAEVEQTAALQVAVEGAQTVAANRKSCYLVCRCCEGLALLTAGANCCGCC